MTAGEPGPAWRTIPALTRFNLSLVVAFSALAGFVCFRHAADHRAWAAFAGVLLLACGASALNQYQERDSDAQMDRTKNRPLPMRQMSGRLAVGIAALLILAGAALLYFESTTFAASLGIFTLLWYNGIYTPLKRRTRFAVLVGAITGALPPLIGYTAAGGPPVSVCLVFSLFMFLWQVSHFQLLLIKYGRQYERAGFPAMVSPTNEKGLRISVLFWMTATVGGALGLLAVRIVSGWVATAVLIAASVLFLTFSCARLVRVRQTTGVAPLLRSLYIYQGIVFLLIIGSGVLNPN